MRPIVITQEQILDSKSEVKTISELIREFQCRVHIRKKKCSLQVLIDFCCRLAESTDVRYLTLHGNAELVEKYSFGGYHDKTKVNFTEKVLFSTSCHSMAEADNAVCDYLFLSPIFDSISKQGYRSPYDMETLREWLNERKKGAKIVALGGIDAANAKKAYEMGFDGVALLGAIWNENNVIENYKNILKNL